MRIFADLHIHSKYARATSPNMDLENLSKFGKLKGLGLIGTGDFTHPKWLNDLKEKLKPIEDTGLYSFNGMNFMLTTEISTVYTQDNKTRKVHHVIHVPSLEIVDQINDELTKMGAKLDIDGRLMLNERTSVEIVEILTNVYDDTLIVPAHIWTPWFSLFGSKSGFDRVEDCYKDQTKHIYALETGMSSDPLMNWRLSSLDKFALMSNSDSHSPWPWRLGRECNAFELEKITYWEILDAIKKKDKKRFLFTVEVSPFYGKYHWTGHRNCNVNLSSKQSLKVNDICPVCHRKLTVGVEERVEELADREEGFVPENSIPFKTLLPLYETISFVTGTNKLYSQPVIREQDKLISKFGNELDVLLNVSKEELLKATTEKIADAIIKVREGRVKYIAGFDGVYGRPVFDDEEFKAHEEKQKSVKIQAQKRLFDF